MECRGEWGVKEGGRVVLGAIRDGVDSTEGSYMRHPGRGNTELRNTCLGLRY